MDQTAKIYVAGHAGMVGSALVRRLEAGGYNNLLVADRDALDLRDRAQVNAYFAQHRPNIVILAAACVGGIGDNMTRPVDFGRDNALITINVLEAAHATGVASLLYLASSCIYPTGWNEPIPESALLSGAPEPTNEMYALAKIFGVRLCEAYNRQHGTRFFSAVPCNVYGPGDRFDEKSGHVVAGLITRMHAAKMAETPSVTVWGDGSPRREFIHVDDLADACFFLLQKASKSGPLEHINVGVGDDVAIRDLADGIKGAVQYEGELVFDATKPNGIARKLVDSGRLTKMGWSPRIDLQKGLRMTYQWYSEHGKQTTHSG